MIDESKLERYKFRFDVSRIEDGCDDVGIHTKMTQCITLTFLVLYARQFYWLPLIELYLYCFVTLCIAPTMCP